MCEIRTLVGQIIYHEHLESESNPTAKCRRWRWRRSDQRRKKTFSWFDCLIFGLVMGSIVLLNLSPIPTSVSASTILPANNNTNAYPAFWHLMAIPARNSQNNSSVTQFNENGQMSNGTRSRQPTEGNGSNGYDLNHSYNNTKKSRVSNSNQQHQRQNSISSNSSSGRSYTFNFVDDFEEHETEAPLFEELSDANFLKNFIDHDEDPMAQESGGPVPYYTQPTASGPEYQIVFGPTAQASDERSELSSPAASALSEISTGDSQSQYDYENGNHGEISAGSRYVVIADADESGEHDVRIPPKLLHNYYNAEEFNSYYYPNQDQHLGNEDYVDQQMHLAPYGNQALGSQTQHLINTKISMIDQISSFYSEHKVLALGGIFVIASLAVLAALLTAYANNLPTEVVLARNSGISLLGRHHVLLDAFLDAIIKVADKYDYRSLDRENGCERRKNCNERGKNRRRKKIS